MDLEKLGKTLREKREKIGIPPSTLAEKTGIRRPTLWIYERGENPKTGKPSRPSKDKLERLAETLHMNQEETEELLSLADYHTPSQPISVSSVPSDTKKKEPAAPPITKIDGVIYAIHDDTLFAFDAETGEPHWDKPQRLQSAKPRRFDTDPLSSEIGDSFRSMLSEKSENRTLPSRKPARQTNLETSSGIPDTSKKKKRRF